MSSTEHSTTSPLLTVRGLEKNFGAKTILDKVSFDLTRGEVLGLIGSSGSGKSTLLRCLNALEDYEAGDVRLSGEPLAYSGEGRHRRRYSDRRLSAERARVGMVFQSYNLFPHLTAQENITLGLRRVRRLTLNESIERAQSWLDRVDLGQYASRYPHQLSGGQQQRIALARAMALEPELMLLDEVTSALDPELVGEVLGVIRDLAGDGMTMIVVSHEMGFVRDVADRVAFMHGGRMLETGTPEKIFRRPDTSQLAAFVARFRETPHPQTVGAAS